MHHARFYLAGLFGVLVFVFARALAGSMRLIVAGDAFFAAYLASAAYVALRSTPAHMRKRASYDDEGVAAILLLTLSAIGLCLGALFALLGEERGAEPLSLALAVASVLLGWFTLHTVMAFRYAHLYYTPAPGSSGGGDRGGLAFPGTPEPRVSEFLYYALVIGMTSQVSDVQASSRRMRRTTLAHGVVSFFFNTVILALAVNIAAGFAR
jgi:uncharacterized membrane protein